MRKYPEELITAFVCMAKRKDIMEKTGISKSRFYRLRADPDFQKVVTERRNELIAEAVRKMEGYLSKDVEILQQIIEDENASPQTRLNGIQLIMNQLGQWRMMSDMMGRLQLLEDALGRCETF